MNLKELVDQFIIVYDNIRAFGGYYRRNKKKVNFRTVITFDELFIKLQQLGLEIFVKNLDRDVSFEDLLEIIRAWQHTEKNPIHYE